jgi:hypothetical protein
MNRARVITVSASSSGAGKTSLLERLIPFFDGCAAIKAHVSEACEPCLLEEKSARESPGKDTSRFLAAGARRAFLVHGPRAWVLDAIARIVRSGEFAVVLIESNAVARELEAELAFFVDGPGERRPGSELCRAGAHVIVASSDAGKGATMPDASPNEVKTAILAAAKDGRITCSEALDLARRLNVSPSLVGEMADQMAVKINACQLGCF